MSKTPEETLVAIRTRLEMVGERRVPTVEVLQALYASMYDVHGILRMLVHENDELRQELAAVRGGCER